MRFTTHGLVCASVTSMLLNSDTNTVYGDEWKHCMKGTFRAFLEYAMLNSHRDGVPRNRRKADDSYQMLNRACR